VLSEQSIEEESDLLVHLRFCTPSKTVDTLCHHLRPICTGLECAISVELALQGSKWDIQLEFPFALRYALRILYLGVVNKDDLVGGAIARSECGSLADSSNNNNTPCAPDSGLLQRNLTVRPEHLRAP
jgi:hypothetical protein